MDLRIITTKIKEHIEKYKVAYLCALTGVVVAGITYGIMRRNLGLGNGSMILPKELRAVLGNAGTDCPAMESTGSFNFAKTFIGSSSNNIVVTIHKNSKGNPGFVTRCLETGELFGTQGDAASFLISQKAFYQSI